MSSASEFGKDFGLISEAVVAGRRAGVGRTEWVKLAHEKELWDKILPVIQGHGEVIVKSRLTDPVTTKFLASEQTVRLRDRDNVHFHGLAGDIFTGDYELPTGTWNLTHCELKVPLGDFTVMNELGGEVLAISDSVPLLDVTISWLIGLANAPAGENLLRTDNKANVAYISHSEILGKKGREDLTLNVNVVRKDDIWRVLCFPPKKADEWLAGTRVFRVTAA